MPLFTWEARTTADEPRSGELAGADEQQVVESLRRQGLRVTRVQLRSLRALPRPAAGAAPGQLVAALRDILALRTAGLTTSEVLELAAARRRGTLARALRSMQLAVDSGVGLGEAFGHHPDAFGSLGAQALAHADHRGTLDPTLAALLDLLAHEDRARDALRRDAARPLVAAVVLLAALALLAGALVPALGAAYVRLGVDTSGAAARLLVAAPYLSLGTSIVAAALALASAGLAAAGWSRSRQLPLPPRLGEHLRRLALARFARALATALTAELPRLQALELAAWEADDHRLREVFLRARSGLSQGSDLGDALADGSLPRAFTRAAQAAERSGDLPAVLRRLADIEHDAALRWLASRSRRLALTLHGVTIAAALLCALALASPLL